MAAATAALVLMAACMRGRTVESTAPPPSVYTGDVEWTVKITGAVSAESVLRGQSTIALQKEGTGGMRDAGSLGVQPLVPLLMQGGTAQLAVLLLPFRGNGRYTLGPGAPGAGLTAETTTAASSGGRERSVVSMDWAPNGDPSQIQAYGERKEECTVNVWEDGKRGDARCPGLGDQTGKVVTIEYKWAALG